MNINSFLSQWLYEELGETIKNRKNKGRTNHFDPENFAQELDNNFEFDVLVVFVDHQDKIEIITKKKGLLGKKHLVLLLSPELKNSKKKLRKIFEATQIDFIDLLEEEKYSLGEEEILQFTSAINNLTLSL